MTRFTYKNKKEMDLTTDDFIEYMCEGIENKKLQEKVNKKNTHFSLSVFNSNENKETEDNKPVFQIRDIPSSKKQKITQFPKETIL